MGNVIVYLIGISSWIALTPFCVACAPFKYDGLSTDFINLVHLCSFFLTFLALAVRELKKPSSNLLGIPYFSLMCLGLFFVFGFIGSTVRELADLGFVASAALGASFAAGYCQWTRLLARFSELHIKVILILGSIASLVTMPLFPVSTDRFSTLGMSLFWLIFLLSYAMLVYCTYQAHQESLNECNACEDGQEQETGLSLSTKLKNLLFDLAIPMLCAMALTLITPIGSAAFKSWSQPVFISESFVSIAHFIALVILALIWFGMKKNPTLLQLYVFTIPVVGSLILFCALVLPSCLWLVVFIGDMSFLIVSILMITTSIAIAQKHCCSVVATYGLLASSVYFTRVVQQLLDYAVKTGFLTGMHYIIVLSLLYILVVPAFFLAMFTVRGIEKKPTEPCAGNSSFDDEMGLANQTEKDALFRACELVGEENSLSPRQTELMLYLARGRSTGYIANALSLSENTIKSYRKALYATLGVHNKQQLIDLVEDAGKELSP